MAYRLANATAAANVKTTIASTSAFTIALRGRLDVDRADWSAIITLYGGGRPQVAVNSGRVWLFTSDNSMDGSSGVTAALGRWYHLAWTRTGGVDSLYVDGQFKCVATSADTGATTVHLGGYDDTGVFSADCTICDMVVADYAMDRVQIAMLAAAYFPPNLHTIRAFYPTFPGATTRTLDVSGNNRALTEAGTITEVANAPVRWSRPTFPALALNPQIGTPSGAIAGQSDATAGQTATLTGTGALASTVAATAGQTGALTGAGALASTSAGTSTASGTLTATGALVGSATGTSTGSATLTGTGVLAGTAAATSSTIATLSLVGTAAATAGQTATLTGTGALAGTANAASTGTLTTSPLSDIDGTAAAISTATGTLTGNGALASTVAAQSSTSAALTGTGALVGTVAATGAQTGELTGTAALISTAAAIATAMATLTATGTLAGTAAATSTAALSIAASLVHYRVADTLVLPYTIVPDTVMPYTVTQSLIWLYAATQEVEIT